MSVRVWVRVRVLGLYGPYIIVTQRANNKIIKISLHIRDTDKRHEIASIDNELNCLPCNFDNAHEGKTQVRRRWKSKRRLSLSPWGQNLLKTISVP